MSTTGTPTRAGVELDPTSDKFSAKSLTISQLVQILSRWDIDLPAKKEKKDFYVTLLNDNLSYIIKRAKQERSLESTAAARISKAAAASPRLASSSASRMPLVENAAGNNIDSPAKQSVISERIASSTTRSSKKVLEAPKSVKRPAVDQQVQFGNDIVPAAPSTPTVFSSSNPFQSPGLSTVHHSGSKASARKPVFSSETATVADKDGKIPINFSISTDPPAFDAASVVGETAPPTSPSKSPISSRRSSLGSKSPKTRAASPTKSKEPEVATTKLTSLQERLLKRNKAKQQSRNSTFISLALGISMLCCVFVAHYVYVDYPGLEYCLPQSSNSKTADMSRVYKFLPACIPCPPSAICSSRAVTGCTGQDQVVQYGVLARFIPSILLPFPFNQPSCQYDTQRIMKESKKARQVDHLIKVLDQLVREYVGKAQCKSRKESPSFIFSTSAPFRVLGMPISASKTELQKLVGRKWDQDTFDEYWSLVIDGIAKGSSHPLSMVVEEVSQHRLFHSSNPPIQSVYCSFKKAVWKWMIENSITLIVGGFAILLGVYGYVTYTTRAYETMVFNSLIEDVIVAIHAENENHHQDSTLHPIPGLAISQLKDHFLPSSSSSDFYLPPALKDGQQGSQEQSDQFHESALDNQGRRVWYVSEPSRTRIWKRVCAAIRKNTNIRETTAHIKGESHAVFKWVGSIALSPLKKRLRIS